MATVVNLPYISQQVFDDNGKPLSSGKLKFFRNNTDVPSAVYTSDGSTALGYEITLDSAGFPETQYALVQDREYTVKAFDSDGVLIWTRNNIVGCGTTGSGPSGDYIPMTGTSLGDPIVGSLVWKDGQYVGTANQHGMVLTDTRSGASILGREGLDIVVGDLEGDYRNYQAKLINTQNDFPGYPDFAELTTRALTLNEETSQNGTRVSKQIDIRPSTTAAGENKITSKGHLSIETYPGGNLHLSGNILSIGAASSIELVPPNSGNVLITNGGGLTTNKLAIGTNLNNKEVNDIWTTSSTGVPSDSQLITAAAALGAGGGPKAWENTQLFNTQTTVVNTVLGQNETISLGWICTPYLDKVKSLTFYYDRSTKTPYGFKAAIYKRSYSGITDPTAYTMDGPVRTYDMGTLGTRVAYKDGSSIPWSGSSFHTISFDDAVEIDPEYLYTFVIEFGMANEDVSGQVHLGGGPLVSDPKFGAVIGVGGVGLPETLALENDLQTRVGWSFSSFGTMSYTARCNNFWIKMTSE